jgi:hypothetical protein
MPIADELSTVIRKTRYLPELLPFLEATNLAAGDNSIISLGIPTVSTDIPILTDKLSAIPNANVLLKLKADRESTHELETVGLDVMGELTPLEFLSTRSLSLVLNADIIVNNYRMYLGIWVIKPSVAQRILWGLPLSSEDRALSTKRAVEASVEKGVLPFPIEYQIQRECMGFKRTYAEIVATVTAGQATPILSLAPPLGDEFLVLESVTADNAGLALANNAQVYVTRDDDRDYLKLPTFAMDSAYDFPCFVPALRKLEISYYADANLVNRYVRFVIGSYKLTELLKARFGQPSTSEAAESAKSGVVP